MSLESVACRVTLLVTVLARSPEIEEPLGIVEVPYNPATARHLGQCEFAGETDAAMLRVLLKVTDKGDFDWSNPAPATQAGRLRTTPQRVSSDDMHESLAAIPS